MKKTGANVPSETADSEERARKGVGSLLRATRLRIGEDVQEVSAALRIRRAYLEAIEDGRFNDLPGVTYAIGFVRTYAEHLGLDGDEVVRRFKAEAQGIGANHELVFPSPVQEGRVPGGAILFVALLLAVGTYGGWYYLSSQGKTIADLVPELPERFASILDNVRGQQGGGEPAASTETTAEPAPVQPAPVPPVTGTDSSSVAPPPPGEPVAQTSSAGVAPAEVEAAPTQDSRQAGEAAPPASPEPAPEQASPQLSTAGADPASPTVEQAAQAETATTTSTVENAVGTGASGTGTPRAAASSEAAANPRQPATPETASAPVPSVAPASPLPRTQAAGLPAAPVMSAPTYGSDADDVRIVLLAVQDSWVQIREADGNLVGAQLLRPGERYRVPNRSGLLLLTGNAGGLELLVDGRKAPPLGPEGAIRRNVPLDPDSLLAGTAISQ